MISSLNCHGDNIDHWQACIVHMSKGNHSHIQGERKGERGRGGGGGGGRGRGRGRGREREREGEREGERVYYYNTGH